MEGIKTMPTFMGVSMKTVSLVTLTFQNSALILIMHYSRIMPSSSKVRYFTSTAVLLNEIIKLSICTTIAYMDRRQRDGPYATFQQTAHNLYRDVFREDSWKLAIPASLYTLQNTLQYVAVSNLDAATFQVTYQLKILTTALFSVTMLGRKLSLKKWTSLILLTAGIAIVQLPTTPKMVVEVPHEVPGTTVRRRALEIVTNIILKRSATYEGINEDHDLEAVMNRSLGLTAVIIACSLSGLAGVYFEKVLKGSSATLWVRNIQLSFYSLFPAFFIGVLFLDGGEIRSRGFFYEYNSVVWSAIAFQAIGGIVVAMCVNFADNIAKNFATSISILISCLASVYFFNFTVTANFLIGAFVVLFATYLYSSPSASGKLPHIYVPFEKTTTENTPTDSTTGKHAYHQTPYDGEGGGTFMRKDSLRPGPPGGLQGRHNSVPNLVQHARDSERMLLASPIDRSPGLRSPGLFSKFQSGEKRED